MTAATDFGLDLPPHPAHPKPSLSSNRDSVTSARPSSRYLGHCGISNWSGPARPGPQPSVLSPTPAQAPGRRVVADHQLCAYIFVMPYQPLEVPPGTDPSLERLVRETVDPLLRDVHAMLMLPLTDQPGLEAGCNFSAALVLLGVVGGASSTLYDAPSLSNLDPRDQPGEAFKQVIERFYPWDSEPDVEGAIRGRHAAQVLYEAFRNPLTHSFGINTTSGGQAHGQRKVAKGAMSDEEITSIERAPDRPESWGSSLYTDSLNKASRTKTVLNIKLFYWGVRQMLCRILGARVAVSAADAGEWPHMTATATTVVTTITNVASTAPDDSLEGS